MSRLIIAPVLGLLARQSIFPTIEGNHDYSREHHAAGPVAL
jgi:hypothetical protein